VKLKSIDIHIKDVNPRLILGVLKGAEERLVRRLAETTTNIQKLQEARNELTTELVNTRFDIREVTLTTGDATELQRSGNRNATNSDASP
jgi:hypothetical protein